MDVLSVVLLALLVIATMFAIKGTIKFDLNQYLRDRRAQQEENLRLLCPHIDTWRENGKLRIRSTYISPPGATAYQCQLCGRVTHDQRQIEADMEYWGTHQKALLKRLKTAARRSKKLRGL